MKLVTFTEKQRARIGILEGDIIYRTTFDLNMVSLLHRGVTPVGTKVKFATDEVTVNAPLVPGKIIAVGRNYAAHAAELGNDVPEAPLLFAKLPSSVIGPDAPITWRTSITQQVDWEGELAVVIGRQGHMIPEDAAYDYVFGYTVANDVTARDLQARESQWLRAKGIDSFCPIGPAIVTRDEVPDPHALAIRTTVNGETMQDASTAQMVHRVPALVSYVSQTFTLMPGDLILTGTPAGVGRGMTPPRFLNDGDTVAVTIDGIGTLSNVCRVLPEPEADTDAADAAGAADTAGTDDEA